MSRWKEQKQAEQARAEAQEQPTLEEFEAGMEESFDELHEAFRERFKKERARVLDVVDSNYYFCVCFSNNKQLEEFCNSVGLNPDEIYYDGREFARKIGRVLKTPDTVFPKVQPFNRDYVERAREKQ